jgi:hypothetical protein
VIAPKRDRSFLTIAAIAATGGFAAIGGSIGFPIWAHLHGQPYNPAFSLFAAWGVAALAGAYACLNTYFLSDRIPPQPPRGGMPLALVSTTNAQSVPDQPSQRRAA